MIFDYPFGATPLRPEELAALIPKFLVTQEELNSWEEKNINRAQKWVVKQEEDILTITFIQKLHLHMFNQTWDWAGKFRISEKNIGVNWHLIPVNVKNLCDNAAHQIKQKFFSADEMALRFHHQLVWIHPFVNGNGRHSRLMADLLAIQQGYPRFSWGNEALDRPTAVRKQYIDSLQCADQGDYSKLLKFARS